MLTGSTPRLLKAFTSNLDRPRLSNKELLAFLSNSAAVFILSAWSSTFLFILSTVFDTAPCTFFTKFGFLNFVLILDNVSLDYAESKLLENIRANKETSIIFYLKTKGKKRGYSERSELDITTDGDKINEVKIEIIKPKSD